MTKHQTKNHLMTKHQSKNHFNNNMKAAAMKVVAIFTVFFRKRRKAKAQEDYMMTDHTNTTSSRHSKGSSFSVDHLTRNKTRSSTKSRSLGSYASSNSTSRQSGIIVFSFEEIREATANFSLKNKIGEGGFGIVYKGTLNDGSLIAVKRAKRDSHGKFLWVEFKNEIFTLSKIEHLNLVKLLGFLEHRDEQIIVVEYVANGTLREHLDGKRTNRFEIAERLDIAIDVAHALAYLHTYSDPPVIHRDIKSSNILITDKLRAKVTDFGFARLAPDDSGATHISTQVKGSAGYLDPEYLKTYQLTPKSDVYSFGVLLVEMVTGRYTIEPKKQPKERITTRWAMQKLRQGDFILVMDPTLKRSPMSNTAVEKVLKLAHQCLAPSRHARPTMKTCAEVLWGIRKDLRQQTIASSSTTSYHSSDYPCRDAIKSKHVFFGSDEGGVSRELYSA